MKPLSRCLLVFVLLVHTSCGENRSEGEEEIGATQETKNERAPNAPEEVVKAFLEAARRGESPANRFLGASAIEEIVVGKAETDGNTAGVPFRVVYERTPGFWDAEMGRIHLVRQDAQWVVDTEGSSLEPHDITPLLDKESTIRDQRWPDF